MDSCEENKNTNKMANESDNEKEPLEDDGEEDLVPEDAFWHIEASRLRGFESGMLIEIEHDDKKFWTAQVTNAFSNLLLIKWSGTTADSWFDVKNKKCYPYGYFRDKEGYSLKPPEKLKLSEQATSEIVASYDKKKVNGDGDENNSFSESDTSKPISLYLSGGLDPSNVFKPGVVLEISHRLDPDKHWFAVVERNVGGRLLVKWFHRCETEPEDESGNLVSFWIYYSHPRIHYLGYAKEKGDISYEPVFLYPSWVADIARFLSPEDSESLACTKYMLNLAKKRRPSLMEKSSIKDATIGDLALTFPSNLGKLVSVVVQSKGDGHLIVSSQTNNVISCYPNDDNVSLMPISWAEEHGVSLYNYEDASNDFRSYLDKNKSNEAPIALIEDERINKFKVNHKLEVVHPKSPEKICEGIVSRVTPPLVWVEISSDLVHVLPYNSTDLFPVGFCEDNSYTITKLLANTRKTVKRRTSNGEQDASDEKTAPDSNNKSIVNVPQEILPSIGSKDACPRIYFNHKCFTGPLLSKSKIRELPRFVGPGPVLLVMQEVIAKIISVAYVPPRVLNEMSGKNFDELLKKNDIENTRDITFKAKYQKKSFRDEIVVITSSEDVPEYCKLVCSHLKCCYNLFGPELYDGDDCPSHCRGLRKTNKVLKRAIYYRQKAAKAKSTQDSAKSASSPSSSVTKDVESSENIEASEITESQEAQEDREDKEKTKEEEEEERDTESTKTEKVLTPSSTVTITTKLTKVVQQPPNNKKTSIMNKVDDDISQEGSIGKKSDGNDSAGELSQEIVPPSNGNKDENISVNHINSNINLAKVSNINCEKSLLKSNKRRCEDAHESASSNGSEKSLEQRSTIQHQNEMSKRSRVAQTIKPQQTDVVLDYREDRQHPLNWTIKDVNNYIKKSQCAALAPTLYEHEIDGPALLLLDHETIRSNLLLGYTRKFSLDDVLKLSHLIRRLKARYFPNSSQRYI